MVESLRRAALTTNLPADITRNEFIAAWRERLNNPTLIPPEYVDESPLYENVFTGKDIDVLSLPVPKWHDEDGGRYIGTAHVVMTQDPDEGWINMGVYRTMVHEKDRLAVYISPGKHGRIHRQKSFDKNKPLKVAISFGQDPLLFLLGSRQIPWGDQELDYAGGIKGAPRGRDPRRVHRPADPGPRRDRHRGRDHARRDPSGRPLRRVARLLRQRLAGGAGGARQEPHVPQQPHPHRLAAVPAAARRRTAAPR